MQLINHFHLNFTFLNLYLKDMLLRPTCRASTLSRDLIRMFKRSLEKSEKPHHMQKQRETGGVPMEQKIQWNKRITPHHSEPRWTSDTPAELSNGTPTELIKTSIKIPFENPTKMPPTNRNPRQWNTTPSPHQTPPTPHHSTHIARHPTSTQVIVDIIRSKFIYTGFMSG